MSNLIHAVARVRALESELLTPSHVDRMISASSFEDAYSVLDDLGYASQASRSRGDLDFEEVLESGLYESAQVFTSFRLGDVFSVLTTLWDIQNIILVLKGFSLGEDEEVVKQVCLRYGYYSRYAIIQAVYHDAGLGKISHLIRAAKAASSTSQMEKIISEGVFDQSKQIAKDSEFLNNYLLRVQEAEDITDLLSEGKSLESVSKQYPGVLWSNAFEKGKKGFEEGGNYSVLETQLDLALLSFLTSQARGKIDGYAPLFAFFWKKERNARVIRSILLAKRAGIAADDIRKDFIPFEF